MKASLTYDEACLLQIYSDAGTRQSVMDALLEIRDYLDWNRDTLPEIVDSLIRKLDAMTDSEFAELDGIPSRSDRG
ncbi:MAG: hypothetical protein J6P31_02845 [Oscillospiraceae bacterium]|nr:hypothetical protein [Oscillospiraceae bacterium]